MGVRKPRNRCYIMLAQKAHLFVCFNIQHVIGLRKIKVLYLRPAVDRLPSRVPTFSNSQSKKKIVSHWLIVSHWVFHHLFNNEQMFGSVWDSDTIRPITTHWAITMILKLLFLVKKNTHTLHTLHTVALSGLLLLLKQVELCYRHVRGSPRFEHGGALS